MDTLILADTMLFLSTLSLRRATRLLKNRQREIVFLSTLSLRRATARRDSRQQPAGISIHALLAESDTVPGGGHIGKANFYPRSPCGERPLSQSSAKSTPEISIHALLAESDTA